MLMLKCTLRVGNPYNQNKTIHGSKKILTAFENFSTFEPEMKKLFYLDLKLQKYFIKEKQAKSLNFKKSTYFGLI